MKLGIDTNIDVALALVDLVGGAAYNWTTRQIETTGLSMAHVAATVPSAIKVAPAVPATATSPAVPAMPADLHADTKSVDCGNALEKWLELSPVWYVVDAHGVPTSIHEIWSNPAQTRSITNRGAVSI